MNKDHDPPHISRTFYARANQSALSMIIFWGILALAVMFFFPVGRFIVAGEFVFEPWTFLIGAVLLFGAVKRLISGEGLDYRAKSFERKIGVVTGIQKARMISGSSCYIFLDDEEVKYKVDQDLPYIEGRIEAKRRTTNNWIHFNKGSRVELFYGQRSKAVVWANILREDDFKAKLAEEAAKTGDGTSMEENDLSAL